MFPGNNLVKNTSHNVVIPFYVYAAVAFLLSATMLFYASPAFTGHYFQPQILSVTHIMALGWGTMIILGASHQLIPVLIESELYSENLAMVCFILAGTGTPLLAWGFYNFNLGWPAQIGGILINASILTYLVNLAFSFLKSKSQNVHAVFVFTAGLWLFLTVLIGILLVFNFTLNLLPYNSLYYLPWHAHMGMIGWLLLMVIGVGSRLIPMFLISKFNAPGLLWIMFALINTALIGFSITSILNILPGSWIIFSSLVIIAISLFGYYCIRAYKQRIRKKVDGQVGLSLLSVLMMMIPFLILITIISMLLPASGNDRLVLAYGYTIFFGWLTAIILGMTFKTLPFIVWNKVYQHKIGMGKAPNPKDIFNDWVFRIMVILYLSGFIIFGAGIFYREELLLKAGSVSLIATALLYNFNVIKMIMHKSVL